MLKNFLIVLICGLFLVSIVSAMSISFFYSPTCPHCQKAMPVVSELSSQYNDYQWYSYDVTQGTYNISAVPTFKIKTDDCREIIITGNLNKLKCELQEMTTPECQTYSASEGTTGGSWFR